MTTENGQARRAYRVRVSGKPRLLEGLELAGCEPGEFAALIDCSVDDKGARELWGYRAHNHYTVARKSGASHSEALSAAAQALKCSAGLIAKGLQFYRNVREQMFALEYRSWTRMGHSPDAALLHAMYGWGYSDAVVVGSAGQIAKPTVRRTGHGGYVRGLEAALAALREQHVEDLDRITLKPYRERNRVIDSGN